MKHLGDITQINGYTATPVNVIIGGSPCQDLSVAGKRAGLQGERSGLFMEQIRIIKEMRDNDERQGRTGADIRPRYMVWENVPGAFSSNKGADFGAVLQETVKVIEPKAPAIPVPQKGWPTAGCLTGDDMGRKWSVAWRVFDAQFWGVPQRRRRIALVADFGGFTAPEILFECESLQRNTDPCGTSWKAAPSTAESSFAVSINNRGSFYGDKTETLRAESHGTLPTAYCIQGNCIDRALTAGCNGKGWTENVSYTLNTVDRPAVVPLLNDQGGSSLTGNDAATVAPTIRAEMHGNVPAVVFSDVASTLRAGAGAPKHNSDVKGRLVYGFKSRSGAKARSIGLEEGRSPTLSSTSLDETVFIALENHPQDSRVKIAENNIVQTLNGKMGTGGGNTPMVFAIDRAAYNQGINAKYDIGIDENGPAYTIVSKGPGAVCIGNGQTSQLKVSEKVGTLDCMHDQKAIIELSNSIVRRLTPLECERLQGYPDGWTAIGEIVGYNVYTDDEGNEYKDPIREYTDGNGKRKKVTDSARYKALGNSISIPNWFYVLQKLTLYCGADTTMASLFDGIGGFPLIWETLNGKGSCVWASEIEEFPIAVTKFRFNT